MTRGPALIAASPSSASARGVADRLVGLEIPSLVLERIQGNPLNLAEFAATFPVAVYMYPGCGCSPEDCSDAPRMDALQHRAFRDAEPDLEAHGYHAIGISSQAADAQSDTALLEGVSHRLLRDPGLRLARELGLPTFEADGARWYQRLTLVAAGGRVQKVFFPVASPARSAAQVLAWMHINQVPG
jgi:peroxiredoxin